MAGQADPDDSPRNGGRSDGGGRIAAVIARLGRLPVTGVFLGALAIGLVALLWPGPVGGVLVLVVAGAVAALLAATWPHHPPAARALRLLVLGALVVIALTKFG